MLASSQGRLEMPLPINCDQCGAVATTHAVQYIYKPRLVDGELSNELCAIVSVIECPHCGIRTQTSEVSGEAE